MNKKMKVDPTVAEVFDSLLDDSLEEDFIELLESFDLSSEEAKPCLKNEYFQLTDTTDFIRDPNHDEILHQLQLPTKSYGTKTNDVKLEYPLISERSISPVELQISLEHAYKQVGEPDFSYVSMSSKSKSLPRKLSEPLKPTTESVKTEMKATTKKKLENPLICEKSVTLKMKPVKRENPLICEERMKQRPGVGAVSKPHKQSTLRKRKSEDWNFQPNTQQRKRVKWEKEELTLLWQGIAQHGNNWTAIKNMVGSRSYCQIKDKGRRALFLLGWQTGRSKTETDCSGEIAKRIAEKVLAGL